MGDIESELRDWAYIIKYSKGKAHVVMLSEDIFEDAANEIKRLRDVLIRNGLNDTWRCPECGGTLQEATHNEDCVYWIGG